MRRKVLAVLTALVLLAGCAGSADAPAPTEDVSPAPTAAPAPTPVPPPPPTPEPDPAQVWLDGMSTEQKVGQLFVAGILGNEPGEDAEEAIQIKQVGGIILFSHNIDNAEQLTALNNRLKELNGDYVPLFLCVDQEGGRVDRMPPELERTPSAYRVGTNGRGSEYGALLAAECAAFGFNMDFAPCLDIWSNSNNTVIGDRAFGVEWESALGQGVDTLNAMRAAGGVVPVVKHFPGHGDTDVDSHYGLPVVSKTLDELWQSELRPFQAAISGDYGGQPRSEPVPAVMVAHLLVTALDDQMPATLSPAVVDGFLRQELGFDGVVCTDDLTMGAVSSSYGVGEAAVLAVEAGCDLLLVCNQAGNLEAAYSAVLEAVNSGRISQERLEESVFRILSLKQDYELTNEPVPVPDLEPINSQIHALLDPSIIWKEGN